MKNLLLLTWKYPFGDGERSFIGSEIPLLTSQFHLTILAADVDTPLYQSMPSPCRVDRFIQRTYWCLLAVLDGIIFFPVGGKMILHFHQNPSSPILAPVK